MTLTNHGWGVVEVEMPTNPFGRATRVIGIHSRLGTALTSADRRNREIHLLERTGRIRSGRPPGTRS